METMLDSLTTFAHWVGRNSLESSLLIGAFLLLSLAWGTRLSPLLRLSLWTIVGIRLLLPFAPASSISLFNLAPDFSPAEAMTAPAETAAFMEI